MQSPSQNHFAHISGPRLERSLLDRSHGHKTAFDAANLIPVYVDEILPGDTLNLRATVFARISTLIFPIMDNVFLDMFFFFVPNRLVWSNWESFRVRKRTLGIQLIFWFPLLRMPLTLACNWV